jgi:nickel/cobalt transporter (NicO) family protein
MSKFPIALLLLGLFASTPLPETGRAWADNPFTTRPEARRETPEPPVKSPFFARFAVWQHELNQKISEWVRNLKEEGGIRPLATLMGIAFAYGAIHAAGPGHGKFVAASYVLSHRTGVTGGLLLGFFTAVFHGFSGVVGVFGLRFLLRKSVGQTLASTTAATRIASFGLVAALGFFLFLKSARTLRARRSTRTDSPPKPASRKSLLPWAAAVGLVPCPAVVMVMLFCLSMDAAMLGVLLAAAMSLGMAATISAVTVAAVAGKTGTLRFFSEKRAETIEGVVGLLAGAAIALFGTLFFLAALQAPGGP